MVMTLEKLWKLYSEGQISDHEFVITSVELEFGIADIPEEFKERWQRHKDMIDSGLSYRTVRIGSHFVKEKDDNDTEHTK